MLPRRATRPKSRWTDWFTLTKRVILGFDLLYQVLIETSGTCWLMFCLLVCGKSESWVAFLDEFRKKEYLKYIPIVFRKRDRYKVEETIGKSLLNADNINVYYVYKD